MRLLISALPGHSLALLVDRDQRLQAMDVLRADRPGRRGDLCLGRVRAIDRGLEAAFVDIGLERPGLLPLSPGGTRINEGDSLVVRVQRAPSPDKGAKLAMADVAAPPGLRPPLLLQSADDWLDRLLDQAGEVRELVFDRAEDLEAAQRRFAGRPELAGRCRLHAGPGPLIDDALQEEIEALLSPRVSLPGGGALLIEPVRSLTAIDVDSAAHTGSGGRVRRAMAVNREACRVIARELRRRALSGCIVVDFLEVPDRAQRREVVEALRQATGEDPEPVQVHAMRASGLVEMTRRRSRPPLHELLARPCGIDGGGWSLDPVTRAFALLRALRWAPPAAAARLRVGPQVAAALRGPAAAALREVETRRGKALDWQEEPDRADARSELVIG